MDETKVLEQALNSCRKLESYIYDSIKMVRRLNIRYNSEWLLKNYKNYMSNIWSQYCSRSTNAVVRTSTAAASTLTSKQYKPKNTSKNYALNARSSHELCGSNRKINYKFIKIKRSMEALILQIQRAIEIANRQKNYIHVNVNVRDSKTRICCH